jgi:hypothetical protein
MSHASKIIIFECNEIPHRVIDRYISANPLSHVAQVFGRSKQFETVCEDQIELDPWISWPTLYRGVIDEQHRIFHLGQSLEQANKDFPPVWDLLANKGVSVGIMGSLHTSTPPASLDGYTFYVPDVFSNSNFAHPLNLRRFQAFNLAMTRKSARNVDTSITWKEAVRFFLGYIFQGLSLSTVKSTLSELFGEMRASHLKCRRRAVQALITLDVFLMELRKSMPCFATVHSNHVAAAMHRFWAATFPKDAADNRMSEDWHQKYKGEIDYAMSVFDTMVGRLSAFVDRHPEYRLLIASSLGQGAINTDLAKGFYTITDLDLFMTKLGIAKQHWIQRFTMVPCVSVVVADNQADEFEARLATVSVNGHAIVKDVREVAPISFSRSGSSFQLFFYFEHYKGPMQLQLADKTYQFAELGLSFYAHQDDVACSARHTPFGVLTVYDPKHPAAEQHCFRISTLDIAPTLLKFFGVTPPNYMKVADLAILDTTAIGPNTELQVEGGGVEVPVTRKPLLRPTGTERFSLAADVNWPSAQSRTSPRLAT